MSTTVDNRVVKMTFDNRSFGKNVNDTLGMLDRLKRALNFSDSKKSLSDLSGAARGFHMGNVAESVEGVSKKFLALSTIGITALANLTNRAVDAGVKIIKALTITPVLDGFKEYELNMNSIQTILANTKSKGSTLNDVTAALDELNTYADKTIYNFAEMTRNIGTFSAAGVDLDTSVRSIKGIANLAAISGSSSQQASTAMYQLSQALASGTVKLMDWNSVVNAGMGGEVFQNALFQTAKAMGTITDIPIDTSFEEWKAAGNSFRDSLQDGWITADVLTTTLEGFTGEMDSSALAAKGFSEAQIAAIQEMAKTATAAATEIKTGTQLISVIQEALGTGWASTWRLILGDFEEAKGLFTFFGNAITGAIDKVSASREQLLGGWKLGGGRTEVLSGLLYSLKAVQSVLAPIKEAFRTVFPPITYQTLLDLSKRFNEFAQGLKIGGETAEKIKTIFIGVFSVFKIGITIIKGIFGVFTTLVGVIFDLLGSLSFIGVGAAKAVTGLSGFLQSGEKIETFFRGVETAIQAAGDAIQSFLPKVTGVFSGVNKASKKALKRFENFTSGITGLFKGSGGAVAEDGSWIEDAKSYWGGGDSPDSETNIFTKTVGSLTDGFNKLKDSSEGVGEAVGTGFAAVLGFFETIGNAVVTATKAVWGFFGDFVSGVKSAFSAPTFAPAIAALGVGFLGAITALLAKFKKDGLSLDFGQGKLFQSAIDAFEGLQSTLKAMQKNIQANTIKQIAIAVAILAASIVVLSFIDPTKITKALLATTAGLAQLVAAMTLLNKLETNPAKMVALTTGLTLLGVAMIAMSVAIAIMGQLGMDTIIKGLIGIAGALGILIVASHFLVGVGSGGGLIKTAASLIILSVSMGLLGIAIGKFGAMNTVQLAQGLTAIAIAMEIMIQSLNRAPDDKKFTKLGISLIFFAFGLSKMADAVVDFAKIPMKQLIKGFASIAVGLYGLIYFLNLMPDNLLETSAGLLVVAGSLFVMAAAVEKMGNIGIFELVKGLAAFAIILFAVSTATNAMNGAAAGAGAMIVVAGAMYILAEVLEKIGKLGLGTIIVGLLGIAGVFVVIGVAAAALALIPGAALAVEALGTALLLVGAGFALFGVGAFLTAQALIALSKAGEVSIGALISIINQILVALPGFAEKFAGAALQFIESFIGGFGDLIDQIGTLIGQIIDKIIELTPKVAEALGAFITAGLELIKEKVPEFIDAGWVILVAFIQGIRDHITDLVTLGAEVLANFLKGIADNVHTIATAVGIVILTFIYEVGKLAITVANAGTNTLIAFITAMGENIREIADSIGDMIGNIIDAIVDNMDKIKDKGIAAAKKFLGGMIDDAISWAFWMGQMILKLLRGIRKAIETYAEPIASEGRKIAKALIGGIIEGIGLGSAFRGIRDAITGVAGKAVDAFKSVFHINSPSKVFMELAKGIPEGIGLGIDKESRIAENSVTDLGNKTIEAFDKTFKNFSFALSDLNIDAEPRITPVLDLSNVQKDAKALSSLISDSTVVPASLSFTQARIISDGTQVASEPQTVEASGPTEVRFEQNIYAPRQLSTTDIYRQTKSQIALAKEELKIT